MRDSAGGGRSRNEAVWARELGTGSKRASIAIGLAMVIAIISVVGASFDLSLNAGRSQFYQVKAHFPTVNGVIEGSDVFFGGVRTGNVSNLEVDKDSHGATITLNIDKKYAPVHEGAKVAVRPKSLLGEKYIAMTVGDPAKAAICDGCQLPDSATAVNVELDELVNILDEPTRKELQHLISNLGTGLAGQGPNLNETFQTGQTNLNDLSRVTDVLHRRDAELKRIIDALTKLTATLSTDPNRATYVNLLNHSDQVLRTLIAEDAQVQQSIDRSDQFFNEIDQGLSGQGGNLQGIFQDLPETITQLDALSVTLGRQGNIGYPVIKMAGAGTIEGPLIFGSQPTSGSTEFTNDMFTRVMPSQGCFSVNGRSPDGNRLQQNNSTVLRDANGTTGVCTIPGGGLASCGGNIATAPAGCLTAVLQALCALHIAPSNVCALVPAPHSAAQASTAGPATAPQAQAPTSPSGPTAPLPQIDPNAVNPILGFLLH